jgi:hypothetical protein
MPELKDCGVHRPLHQPVPVHGNGNANLGRMLEQETQQFLPQQEGAIPLIADLNFND